MRYWRRKRNTKDLVSEIILVYKRVNKNMKEDIFLKQWTFPSGVEEISLKTLKV